MSEFKLPDVGEGLTEAEIVAWKVKVGDVIEINDIVVEIETAKSLVELPSPYAGTVLALMVPEGEMIPVGTPIISIGDPSEAGRASAGRAGTKARAQPEMEIDLSNPRASGGGEGESLVGRNKADRDARTPRPQGRDPGRRRGCRRGERPDPGLVPARPVAPMVEGADEPAVPSVSAPDRVGRQRRAGAGQAAGPQAGQGPRRRHLDADPDRPRRHRHPRGRRVRGRCGRRGRRQVDRTCARRPVVGGRPSASGASRSRASAR